MLIERSLLPEPPLLRVPEYEVYVDQLKALFVERIRQDDPALADQVAVTLQNDSELLTKMAQTFGVMLLNETRRRNEQAKAVLPGYSKGADLDHVVSNQGISRQEIKPGDLSAFPPVEPVLESDEDLLRRYFLSPHRPAAGSRLQYKAVGMMLDEVPVITVTKPAADQVQLNYQFAADGWAARIKDVEARRTAPGQVKLAFLLRPGVEQDDALLDRVRAVLDRDNVKPETDDVEVAWPDAVSWDLNVIAWVRSGPDPAVQQAELEKQLTDYAELVRVLGGHVQRSRIDQVCHNAGAERLDIVSPAADVLVDWHQVPKVSGIQVEVRVLP